MLTEREKALQKSYNAEYYYLDQTLFGLYETCQRTKGNKYVKTFLTDLLKNNTGMHLDVGCGYVNAYMPDINRTVSLDFAQDAFYQQKMPVVGHAASLPFEDNTFSAVVAKSIYCILDNPSVALAEWIRVLKPSGLLVIIDFQGKVAESDTDYLRNFEPDKLAVELSSSNMNQVRAIEIERLEKVVANVPEQFLRVAVVAEKN